MVETVGSDSASLHIHPIPVIWHLVHFALMTDPSARLSIPSEFGSILNLLFFFLIDMHISYFLNLVFVEL